MPKDHATATYTEPEKPVVAEPQSVLENFPLAIYPIIAVVQLTLFTLSIWNITILGYGFPLSYNDSISNQIGNENNSAIQLWSLLLALICVCTTTALVICMCKCRPFTTWQLVLAFLMFPLAGSGAALQISNWQLNALATQLNSQYQAAVSQSKAELAAAAQTCASQVLSDGHSFTSSPCSVCETQPWSWRNDGLVTSVANEQWSSPTVYWTQQIRVEEIVCEGLIEPLGTEIWAMFRNHSIFANQSSSPEAWPCYSEQAVTRPNVDDMTQWTQWLDHGGMTLFLIGIYQQALAYYPPMIIEVSQLATSDCVLIKGTVARRFPLTSICGSAGAEEAPNPLVRQAINSEFQSCSTPQLANYQMEYAENVASLNQSVYAHPALPPAVQFYRERNGGMVLLYVCFFALGIVLGPIFLALAMHNLRFVRKKQQESCPTKANEKTNLVGSINA